MFIFPKSRQSMRFSYLTTITCLVVGSSLWLAESLWLFGVEDIELWVSLAGGLCVLAAIVMLENLRIGTRRHITIQERLSQRAVRTYERDPTTNALTRLAFMRDCQAKLRNERATPFVLIQIDMDYLKRLNDSCGHDMGDAALRHLGTVARETIKDHDAILGRLGGDEFALLVSGIDGPTALAFCRHFLTALGQTAFHGHRPMNLSASIGLAPSTDDCDNLDDLLHRADLALYESKRNGRGQATLFDREMLRDFRQERFIERELRAAILLNQLTLAYQPIVRNDETIWGYEALVRWNNPVRGIITPDEFIAIAERSTLIDLLGKWVLRRALSDAAAMGDAQICVNFSMNQFKRDDVVQTVRSLVEESGIAPHRLVIELTESASVTGDEQIAGRIQAIRALGVRIALDDFGTGYTGFAQLRTFPIDIVKIDRSFVAELGSSEAGNVLVAAMVQVASALGATVVAEGIETEEQQLLCRIAGCECLQGFYIARPASWSSLKNESLASRLQTSAPCVELTAA